MAFYILGTVICLAVAVAGGLALRWATRMSARVEQLEADNANRSPVFLGVDQEQFDELKKVVGVNATAFAGNLRIQGSDVEFLKAKVKEIEKGMVSVANEVADIQAEPTKQVVMPSGQPPSRDLPFST
jgi:hypothetical protein